MKFHIEDESLKAVRSRSLDRDSSGTEALVGTGTTGQHSNGSIELRYVLSSLLFVIYMS